MEEKLYNISDLEIEDKLVQFQQWIRNHQELPQKIGKNKFMIAILNAFNYRFLFL